MLSIDHVKELNHLEFLFQKNYTKRTSWHPDQPLLLCGSARSGKTTAVREFCGTHSQRFYFSFQNLSESFAPRFFSISRPDIFPSVCDNWDDFFSSLREHFNGKYHVLVFDDLDTGRDRDGFLRALSAYMSENSQPNPLVILPSRRVDSLPIDGHVHHIRSYSPADLKRSFPRMSDEDRMRLYSITDGLTGLLSLYDEESSFEENLRAFCSPGSPFHRYGASLLRDSFRSPDSYSGILYAMSIGKRRLSDIAAFCDYTNKKCGTYLQALCDAGFVHTKKERSDDKRSTTRYCFDSGYMALWSRFLMLQQACSATDNDAFVKESLDYIDRIIVPDRFRYCCERWFDDHKRRYESIGHGFTEFIPETGEPAFDHIYKSGRRMCFLKIWTDIDGRYGSKAFKPLEDHSSSINTFYDNYYFLFSIHRFSDSMWELSQQYDNLHLIESRFLSF